MSKAIPELIMKEEDGKQCFYVKIGTKKYPMNAESHEEASNIFDNMYGWFSDYVSEEKAKEKVMKINQERKINSQFIQKSQMKSVDKDIEDNMQFF